MEMRGEALDLVHRGLEIGVAQYLHHAELLGVRYATIALEARAGADDVRGVVADSGERVNRDGVLDDQPSALAVLVACLVPIGLELAHVVFAQRNARLVSDVVGRVLFPRQRARARPLNYEGALASLVDARRDAIPNDT